MQKAFRITVLFLLALVLKTLAVTRRFLRLIPLLNHLPGLRTETPSASIVHTPEARFEGIPHFPFQAHFLHVETPSGKVAVHYVDEGSADAAETMVCLHGEPSWSYLYRKMIPVFVAAGMRVVAFDFIGFGKSDKFTARSAYTVEMHQNTFLQVMTRLNIKGATLIVQDWGGLIGLSTLPDLKRDAVRRCVIMNTGLPPHKTSLRTSANFLVWRSAVELLDSDIPVGSIMSTGCKHLSAGETRAYAAPFPSPQYAVGAAVWPLLVPLHRYSDTARNFARAKEFLKGSEWMRPTLVLYSNKCPVTRDIGPWFAKVIPNAQWSCVEGAGHFLQDDAGADIATRIVTFCQTHS